MKKKILFVNDEMVMGGVARILNTLLENIDLERYEVDLLVLHPHGELLAQIPKGINVISGTPFFKTVDIALKKCRGSDLLNKLRLLLYMKSPFIFKRIQKERALILKKHYDIEFSAKEGFCTIFTAASDSDLKLNWVQVDYKVVNYASHHMKLMKKALAKIDLNIACSEGVKDSYSEIFGVKRICVIHNLMNEKMIKTLADKEVSDITPSSKIKLISVARFHYQKGLDILIRAYSEVKDAYELTIIGDGELRDELHELAKDLGVYDRIKWLGIKENPYPYIKASDLFVMTSRYEGYPTIILEALMAETPCLVMEVAGIKEQLKNEWEGIIIPNDEKELVKKLLELKDKKALLEDYKRKLSTYHYDNEGILKSLDAIFNGGRKDV